MEQILSGEDCVKKMISTKPLIVVVILMWHILTATCVMALAYREMPSFIALYFFIILIKAVCVFWIYIAVLDLCSIRDLENFITACSWPECVIMVFSKHSKASSGPAQN